VPAPTRCQLAVLLVPFDVQNTAWLLVDYNTTALFQPTVGPVQMLSCSMQL